MKTPFLEQLKLHLEKEASRFPMIAKKVSAHLGLSDGKAIRALLIQDLSLLLGASQKEHLMLAAGVELLHSATLLHDDVVDDASLRRGKEPSSSVFGNGVTVLCGDYLFAHATRHLVGLGERIAQDYGELVPKLIQGELDQWSLLFSKEVPSLESCFEVIFGKTAILFSFACSSCALLSNPGYFEISKSFGRALGEAFQLKDDLLDYTESQEKLGKKRFQDFLEGKWTAVSVLGFESMDSKEKEALKSIFGKKGKEQEAYSLLEKHGAFQKTRDLIELKIAFAKEQLDSIKKAFKTSESKAQKEAFKRLEELLLGF